ncbi:dynamin family protein [Microcoleus sp. LEGE 07076]|uniref:dynamin family protein n=1 Tax=Microcoleus sp. LEGE 07076 TaxID=915322 RepID=UPI00187ED2A3|nr:dynamin family protein [Microcoleus sp. LEGE 07076]MBE9187998.1 dynamin family protein [Microcoleus sp. LEGE 07076]
MDTSLISSQTVELVSRLTGQKLRQEDITPPVLFLAGLVTVLLGVIHADGTVSAEETQRLRTTFTELIPANNSLRQLVMLMVKGVRDRQVYNKVTVLLALTACFSEEEKLLLISFGYQMSAADGTIEERAKEYLQNIANRLGIAGRYLTVLEASFSSQAIRDTAALAEVHSLLDPAGFQSLDSLFVRAASHILQHLPAKPKQQTNRKHSVSSYQELKKFQEYRQQLNAVCGKLGLTLRDKSDRNVLSPNLAEEITKVSQRLQSPCFRVAVVGEFSKGKSTLLNALLGEEIQPVRDIPCSGNVTILKYGSQRRVICRYKNGREEEIPPAQYQEKASISEEAAYGSYADEEIAKSEIAEIVFEHPDLELCRNGVEIIDSPGLNEQAERTLVTQQVLKTTDAVIFLTHAQNALTEKERELLLYLKKELNYGNNEGAGNIFMVVNFFDLLRREESRQQVRKRVETIVKSQNLIVAENRIHFISAQSALKAILEGNENDDYQKSFQGFTDSIEKFLTVERGAIALQQSAAGIKQIINTGCDELSQYREILAGKLTISQGDKAKIFEQMAEASGRDVKMRNLANKLREESVKEATESWNEWVKILPGRLATKSNKWTSKHSHIWSQDKLIRDYAYQFVLELTQEIDVWSDQKLQFILKQKIETLDFKFKEEFYAIRQEFQEFDRRLSTSLVTQFNNLGIGKNLGGIGIGGSGIASSINPDIGGPGGFLGGLGLGGLVAAGLLFFAGLGIIPVILGGLAAGGGGTFGLGMLDVDGIHNQIKEKVRELGFEKFGESSQSIFDKIHERIIAVFEERVETSSGAIAQAMSLWENLLEQQEMRDRQNQAECDAEKVWLADKRRELQEIENQIEAILGSPLKERSEQVTITENCLP